MTCQSCVDKISDVLARVDGVGKLEVDLHNKTVLVDTSLPSTVVQSHIESTGMRAVLKGYGVKSGVIFTSIHYLCSNELLKEQINICVTKQCAVEPSLVCCSSRGGRKESSYLWTSV